MAKERKFDLERFRDRCVQEFCELTDPPTQINGHKKNALKHYAPGVQPFQYKQWKHASKHVLTQTHFTAPFIFDKDTAYGIIDMHRPIMVIKFGNQVYWRSVPKRDAEACVEVAKEKNLYAKLRTIPIPKRTEVKEQTVESFIERVRLETLNPESAETKTITLLRENADDLPVIYSWHSSATFVYDLVFKTASDKRFDVGLMFKYRLSFPHMQASVESGWVVLEEKNVGFFIEWRIGNQMFCKKAPEFLEDQLCEYAKQRGRLFKAPTFLKDRNRKDILFLKK